MICLTVIRFYPVFESQKIKKVNKHIRILIDIQCDKYNEIIDTAKKKEEDWLRDLKESKRKQGQRISPFK